jgi:hypothetical protein
MNSGRELIGQGLVDQSLPHHPALTGKGRGHDGNREVRLAAGLCSRVPDMLVRLILDVEPDWGEPVGQLAANRVGNEHAAEMRNPADAFKRSPPT